MATGPGYPAGNPGNTYVPRDISNRLRIGFSRNPDKFYLPRYVQYVETPNDVAYYLKLTTQEAGRVTSQQDFAWPDGVPSKATDDGTESFQFIPFQTQRYEYVFRLGDKAAKQASWPIVEQNGANKAAQCMTARTSRMMTAATTASTWQVATNTDNQANLSADHTGSAASIAGGYLDQGTGTVPYLRIALGYIADLINQDTLGVIDSEPGKYFVLMNPKTARLIGNSPEMHDFLRSSYDARREIHEGSGPNAKYGLPGEVYGYKIVVENCVVTTNLKNATLARSYAMPNQTILVCSRVGGLDGTYGAPSFSTLTMFWFNDEMTIEAEHENWDRLTYGRVVEDNYMAVTCTASGYLITSATSS